MTSSALIDRLNEYGADIQGIQNRFMGDAELYEKCFLSLFEDPNIPGLRDAVAAGEYEAAFQAAHALKGVTGNLGLAPLYQAVCALVESLRETNTASIETEYETVRRELDRVRTLADGSSPAPAAPPEKKAVRGGKKKISDRRLGRGRLILAAIATILLVSLLVGVIFFKLTSKFSSNVAIESSSHLEEINYQIKLYIEGEIETDWQVAYSVRNSFTHSVRDNDEANLREFLAQAKSIWRVDDIIIYTENGVGMKVNGEMVANDVASRTIYNANELGEYVTVVQSTIIYTLPVESKLLLNDSRIVAISVERDLQSFLDSMEFSSFGGAAYVYLTQSGGRVVSQLSVEGATPVYNVTSSFADGSLVCLTDPAIPAAEMFTAERALTFLLSRDTGTEYFVVTPVKTRHMEMNLVYTVSEAVVNEMMNRYRSGLAMLSAGIISVLVVIILAVFMTIYRMRKKQFAQAIISRERTFDLLVENTNTAFALLSTEQKEPVFASANAADIISMPVGYLQRTESGFRYVSGDGREPQPLREVNQALADWDGKTVFESGYVARSGGEDPGYYEVRLYPVAENGHEYVAVIQDVTQQFHRENAVRNALDMAERANAAKSRFLSNMSHDIRTPMNAIVNMTQFAKENKNDPALLDEYLNTISESSDRLLQLINDVLDMSRIERGQVVVDAAPFDLRAELRALSDTIRPLCAARGQTFSVDLDGLPERGLLGDRVKVTQVLMNILGNAVKFTPEGGRVDFTAAGIPSLRAGLTAVRFTVRDNGIGIPEASLPNIFNAFMRVDDKRVSKVEGTGLGLSICKSYVSAMGGTITCRSEEGKGTVFTVELSFEETEAAPAETAASSGARENLFPGKRCLLCEDNDLNQIIARKLLERLGFAVEIAADGREGVMRFSLSDEGYYDIIYMDIQMPVMDGYEAAAAIRGSAHPQAETIPIIAMTANVFAEDVEKARKGGMNGHLGKPIKVEELVSETERLLDS